LVVAAVAAALAAPGLHLAPEAGARPAARLSYVVRPGDTLWSIAERVVGPSADPRPLAYAIQRANGVDPGSLVPGQTLVIPSAG